jgi:hypothetical protein
LLIPLPGRGIWSLFVFCKTNEYHEDRKEGRTENREQSRVVVSRRGGCPLRVWYERFSSPLRSVQTTQARGGCQQDPQEAGVRRSERPGLCIVPEEQLRNNYSSTGRAPGRAARRTSGRCPGRAPGRTAGRALGCSPEDQARLVKPKKGHLIIYFRGTNKGVFIHSIKPADVKVQNETMATTHHEDHCDL